MIVLSCLEAVDHIWNRTKAWDIALLSFHVASYLLIFIGWSIAFFQAEAAKATRKLISWNIILCGINCFVVASSLTLFTIGLIDFITSLWVSQEAKLKHISNET
jgi:hypothetical protein